MRLHLIDVRKDRAKWGIQAGGMSSAVSRPLPGLHVIQDDEQIVSVLPRIFALHSFG